MADDTMLNRCSTQSATAQATVGGANDRDLCDMGAAAMRIGRRITRAGEALCASYVEDDPETLRGAAIDNAVVVLRGTRASLDALIVELEAL